MAIPYAIEELEKLRDADFINPEVWDNIEETITSAEETGDFGLIDSIRRFLHIKEEVIRSSTRLKPDIIKLWESDLSRCEFLLLPSVSLGEIDNLFRQRMLYLTKAYTDLRLVVDSLFRTFGYDQLLLPRLNRLTDALQNNVEKIGSAMILRADGKKVPPEVQWWIKEYRSANRGVAKPGALEEATFFIKNQNAKNLKDEDRQNLLKILQLLDFFANPPTTDIIPTGHNVMETEQGGTGGDVESYRQEARLPTVVSAAAPLPTANVAVVKDDSLTAQVKASEKIIEDLLVEDPERIVSLAHKIWDTKVGERQVLLPRVIAGVRVLIKKGNGALVITQSPEADKWRALKIKGAILLGPVLKQLYQDTWGMPEEEAAREAAHIGSLLSTLGKHDYLNMAYYDMMDNKWKWKT